MKRREFVRVLGAAGTGLLLNAGSPFTLHAQQAPMPPDPAVKRVLVMFKCHFDAGFVDTQYNVVHKRYFEKFFPQAIETARAANQGGKRRYVWTTGSWLLFEYLEQASPADRKAMEQAIARGDIAWHALPFTWQTEMLSPSMIEGSLALSKSLDHRFGAVTTGAKMTDVPGHTRGIVPPLAKHGVNFLEIGVNGASAVAKVPPIFLWKDPSGASLPVMYHWDYEGIARVPGSDLALVTRVRGDNTGPHTADEIAAIYADLTARFPNAEITACNLSDMAKAIQPYRVSLPVVTQEMGDTWIYGCASDPLKVARFRELARLREGWLAKGSFKIGDATDLALLRHVLLEAEHTWGTDTKTWLDFDNYEPADLTRMLDTKNYKVVQFSWQEKRQDLLDGVATLPAPLREQADRAIVNLKPTVPSVSGTAAHLAGQPNETPHWVLGIDPKTAALRSQAERANLKPTEPSVAGAAARPDGQAIETPHFVLGIDPKTGAITRLRNKATGREWAGAANPIALLTYQTLSPQDYDRFLDAYLVARYDWALKDFGKPNIERFGAVHQDWLAASAAVFVEETAAHHRILIQPRFEDDAAFQSGRASFPRQVFVEILLPKAEPVVHLNVSWFQKPATRLPESLWLTFNPIAADQKGWSLDKSGEPVSPLDVVASGNRQMHSLGKGFSYREAAHTFAVETLDAPVVAVGERTPLLFSNAQPDLTKGIHSCLYNNAWGTNYIMWYGEDAKFRYVLKG